MSGWQDESFADTEFREFQSRHSPFGVPFWTDRHGTVHMNFAHAEHTFGAMSTAELKFCSADCKEAIEANPESPKAGYYADCISVIGGILKTRKESP